ncbi:MAG: hypothetical protein ACOY6N_07290 [Pseudomonadota bacterium]|nr:hypothetical protein [Sulfuricystis thermophila]MDI6748785.1 hypothetical protein [Rhodocyclaceae bacterium]
MDPAFERPFVARLQARLSEPSCDTKNWLSDDDGRGGQQRIPEFLTELC